MWCSGSIKGQNIFRCTMYDAISRSLVVRSLVELSSISRHCLVVSPMGSLHTNHCPLENFQTPPIPFRDVSIAPVHVGRWDMISLKWVGLLARERIRCHHRLSLLCTCEVTSTLLPSEVFIAFCNLLNIPVAPGTIGMALYRKPKIRNHFCVEIRLALFGTPSRSEESFFLLVWGRVSSNFTVFIYQPRTVLLVLCLSSPLSNFFREIGSSLTLPWRFFGRENLSM